MEWNELQYTYNKKYFNLKQIKADFRYAILTKSKAETLPGNPATHILAQFKKSTLIACDIRVN